MAAFCEAERLARDDEGVYVRVTALKADDDELIERTPWEGPLRASSAVVQGAQPAALISRVMTRASRDASGANVGVCEDTILQLDVRARHLPDLNLLDLPGVVGGSVEGEPDDMAERTKRLVERHLQTPDTLVLVVVEATAASVRNSLAFSLVQAANKVDKALGVLTKADGCVGPSLARLRTRLDGTAKDLPQLAFGYIAVANRDSCDGRNLSIADAAREEREWITRNLPSELQGSGGGDALVSRLATMLTTYVRDVWAARALALLRAARTKRRAALNALGAEVATSAAAREELFTAVLAPLPKQLCAVGQTTHWYGTGGIMPFLLSSLGDACIADISNSLASARESFGIPDGPLMPGQDNAMLLTTCREMVLDEYERRAFAVIDRLLTTKREPNGDWESPLFQFMSVLMQSNGGQLPLRPTRFVYLHEQVVLQLARFLAEEREPLDAGIPSLLLLCADCNNPFDIDGGSCSWNSALQNLRHVAADFIKALNRRLLQLVGRAWLEGGPLASTAALKESLLAETGNGIAALLAEDAATAAQRSALKRAGVDLRTAIVAIAGLHDPPALLDEDAAEDDGEEVPLSVHDGA